MTGWLAILISSAGGAAVTLLGVATGGFIAGRSQTRQWIRDKQISACTTLIEESTRMQLALQRQQRHGRKADWTAWNQALAVIWLIGVPDVIDAAAAMDRVFWTDGTRIKTGQITDDDAWAVARDRMGSARLDFVNAAGRNIVRSLVPVTDLPSRGLLCLGSSGCRNRALISPLRPKPPLAAEQNRDRRSVIP